MLYLAAGLLLAPAPAPASSRVVHVTLEGSRPPPRFVLAVDGVKDGVMLREIVVSDLGRHEIDCRLLRLERTAPRLIQRWHYGQSLRGFSRTGCGGRLAAGHYAISLVSDEASSVTLFDVEANGELVLVDPP
jgi:hypothetical protein